MSTHYYGFLDGKEISLAQTASGWNPLLHWHNGYSSCPCHCEEHHYRNFDEFVDFVCRDDVRLENEYGEQLAPFELIGKLQRFQMNNDKEHREMTDRDSMMIDGWEFYGGNWE